MHIRGSHNRKVSFDTKEKQRDKIDILAVMMGKLATRDSGTGRDFKPQIYQGRGRGQNRGNYDRHSYDQQSYQNSIGQIVETEDSIDRTEVGLGRYEQNYTRGNFRGNVRSFNRQNSRGEYRNKYRNEGYDRSRNRSRERSFSRSYSNNRNKVQAIVGRGQDLEPVQIETEQGVISVGNMIILQGTVPLLQKREK